MYSCFLNFLFLCLKSNNKLKETMENRTRKNKEKIDLLTETVCELKDSIKVSMSQQEQMNNTIMEAMQLMQRQMTEITSTQTKIQAMFMKMGGVYTPLKETARSPPRTQPCTYDLTHEDTTDDDSMDFNMTNLKRTRDERIIDQIDLKSTPTENTENTKGPMDTPERNNLSKRPLKSMESDPRNQNRKGHNQK